MSNYPVLVSSTKIASGTPNTAATVSENGVVLYDHDLAGQCFDDSGKVFDYHNQVLRFDQAQHLSCAKTFANMAALETYCTSADW